MSKRTLYPLGIIIFSLVITLCASPDVGAADVGNDDALLSMLPENCMFCVRINNFNGSLGKLDAYLAGASPIPMSLAMLANMQLGAIIGDPMLTGIDMGGDFAIFAIPPQADQAEPVVGMLIPVTDYKTFVEINPNCKEGEGGIAILSAPNSPAGNFAMKEAGYQGKYALVVSEHAKEKLSLLAGSIYFKSQTSLARKVTAGQAKEAASAPAWAYANIAGLYKKYNEDVLATLEMAQQGMVQSGGPAKVMGFYFKMLPELFKEFGGETDSATIALTPESTTLSVDVALQAKDGTELSKMLVSDKKNDGYTLTGYLDNNNAVNGLMKMNRPFMQTFYDKVFDIMGAITDDPASKDQTAKMKALTQKMITAMGDEISFSYSYAGSKPPFKLQEVGEVKDSAAMKAMMTEGMEYANTLYKAMGIPAELKYEPGVSTYKNTSIDTISISIVASDDPNNMMQKEIEKMYGGGFKYYMAQTSDKFYVTMGSDSEQTLKALIYQPASSPAPSGDIKIAMDTLQNTPYDDFVCSVNIIKLMKGMGEMMQTMGVTAQMGPVADMFGGLKDIPSQSCFVTGGNISDGSASIRIALPKQHLIEVVSAAMLIQQQMQQQMQNQQPDMVPQIDGSDPRQSPTPVREVSTNPLQSWVGKPAPEMKMVDLEGKIHRISRLKGKKVILDFWATWCPPCRKAIPDLIKLAGSNSSDLVILGLSDETADKLTQFSKEAKMNYPVIPYNDKLPAPYGQVTGLPTLFLIDSEGIIRDVLVGYHEPEDFQSRLKEIK